MCFLKKENGQCAVMQVLQSKHLNEYQRVRDGLGADMYSLLCLASVENPSECGTMYLPDGSIVPTLVCHIGDAGSFGLPLLFRLSGNDESLYHQVVEAARPD